MKRILTVFLLVHCSIAFAQNKPNTGALKIIVHTVFGKEQLQLQNREYANAHGDSLYIDEFRFYLSNLKFSTTGVSFWEPDSYHLVDAADKDSRTIYIKNIPAGNYTTLDLMLGVDSMANVSGANEGDLDPVKAMYWAWNTGYIMAKLQGHSKVCKTLHHAFEFHIGGYLPPYNAVRNVRLPLQQVTIAAGKENILEINADAAAWFNDPEMIDLSKTNEVNMPGKDAMMIADNYADMLSVETGGQEKQK